MQNFSWPYPLEWEKEQNIETDVLVLGGGIACCMAAIAAARKGARVILVEKGATEKSGAGGSGCDHWESAASNPCSKVSPEELVRAMLDDNDGYNISFLFSGVSQVSCACRDLPGSGCSRPHIPGFANSVRPNASVMVMRWAGRQAPNSL